MITDPSEWMDDYHRMLCDAELTEAANDEINIINQENMGDTWF